MADKCLILYIYIIFVYGVCRFQSKMNKDCCTFPNQFTVKLYLKPLYIKYFKSINYAF